jgi:hypothetical protein
MSKYPEHEKMKKIADESQACGDFIHWATHKGYIDIKSRKRTEELLAEYFKIDLNKIEQEKRAMLALIRRKIRRDKI